MQENFTQYAVFPTAQSVVNAHGLFSEHAILLNAEGGSFIYELGADETIYPASMTKMMTAIVVLENGEDYTQIIQLQPQIFEPIYTANAAVAGFEPLEEVRILDLLYGMMLPSGAECAVSLAGYVAGRERNFIQLMNVKASELEMSDTHFVNVTGLHSSEHYTTVRDLSILLSYALKNDTFYSLFTCHSYTTQATNLHPQGLYFESTLFSKTQGEGLPVGRLLGGKTGYTPQAGQCLASLAQVGDQQYILITSGAMVYNDYAWQTKCIQNAQAQILYGIIIF